METIREIVSFSHDGIARMWYPFSVDLDPNNTIISAEYYYEVGELFSLLLSMFATNNHQPELMNKENLSDAKKFLTGELKKRTECSVTFKTDTNQYRLQRCFYGNYSLEAKLHKIDSSIVHYGQNAIQMLRKFHKPFIIINQALFNNGSSILKPENDFTRNSMVSMANNWAKMIGINDSRIKLDYAGRWSTSDGVHSFHSRRNSRRTNMPSPLLILTYLAQAVMRKRKYGKSPPIFSSLNVESLNGFEAIAMLDLIKCVASEESIQFIVAVNEKPEINSMLDVISTPKMSIYEKN